MEATITPTHTCQILRTATAVTLGAAIGALFTIGINAVQTGDDSSETRAARGLAIASYNLPATVDAAEHWLTTDRSGVDAHATSLSADAAEHWLTTDRSGVDAHATPLSADAAEHWLTTDRSGVDAHATPLSADAAEHWLTRVRQDDPARTTCLRSAGPCPAEWWRLRAPA